MSNGVPPPTNPSFPISKQDPQIFAINAFRANCQALFRGQGSELPSGSYTIGFQNGSYTMTRNGENVDLNNLPEEVKSGIQKLVNDSGLPQGTVQFNVPPATHTP